MPERVIADAVVHPYNLAEDNQNPDAQPQLESVYAAHTMSCDDAHAEYVLSREEFFSDVSYETIASALFVESDVDFAVIHALPNLGFARRHVTEPRRAAAFRDRHPERFALYATVDTHLTAAAIEELSEQVDELAVDGLKLYPAFFYEGRGAGWRLDGDDFALPLLEAAYDMGIRRVAVHKALWLPPAPREAFAVDDFGGALERFPDVDFFMVHAGMAFAEQTAGLLARYPNLHATLESMFAYILVRPDRFADILGRLLAACGPKRLLYGSGANLMHPRPILDAFADYELPEAVLERYEIPQLTAADRDLILGGNALRLHGRDPATVRARVAGDVYDRARRAGGRSPVERAARPRRYGGEVMEPTREQIRRALATVPEPCSIAMRAPMDICEMGLVQEIAVRDGAVRVVLVLTDPSCVHFLGMRRYIEDVLGALDGVTSVEVVMSTTELWTSDRMRPRPAAA